MEARENSSQQTDSQSAASQKVGGLSNAGVGLQEGEAGRQSASVVGLEKLAIEARENSSQQAGNQSAASQKVGGLSNPGVARRSVDAGEANGQAGAT